MLTVYVLVGVVGLMLGWRFVSSLFGGSSEHCKSSGYCANSGTCNSCDAAE